MPFIEPFIAIPYLAAQTEKNSILDFCSKISYPSALDCAKQLSSLAMMIGDRFDFGVGISPWPEDFEATQIAWEKRGKRMDEMMEIINGLLTGEYFEYKGEIFDLASIKLTPTPDFHVPLLVGGHAKPALRRAARLSDGWIAAGGKIDEYKTMIDTINEFRKEYGRDHLPFPQIQAMSHDSFSVDGLMQLYAIGVTEVIIAFRDVYGKEAEMINRWKKKPK